MSEGAVGERGLTPVLATILLVVVVVVVAGTLAVGVFGFLASNDEAGPIASFEVSNETGKVVITHTDGDNVDPTQLYVRVDDPDGDVTSGSWDELGGATSNGAVAAGTSLTLSKADGDETVKVVWIAETREETALLTSWEGDAPPNIVTEIDSCGKIDEGGTYKLTKDVSSSGDCFEVSADGVTIDGNGHTIEAGGTASGTQYGIKIATGSTVSDITVKDVTVEDADTAYKFENVEDATFSNLTARSLEGFAKGFVIENVDNTRFEDLEVSGPQIGGVEMRKSDNNEFVGLDVGSGGSFGISVQKSNGNRFEDVYAVNKQTIPVELTQNSDGNTLINVTAKGSSFDSGIVIDDSNDNVLKDSLSKNNAKYGVLIKGGAKRTDVRNVEAVGNSDTGFKIENSDQNSFVKNNDARNNGGYGYCASPKNSNEYNKSKNAASGNSNGAYC